MKESINQHDLHKLKQRFTIVAFVLVFAVFAAMVMMTVFAGEQLLEQPDPAKDAIRYLETT